MKRIKVLMILIVFGLLLTGRGYAVEPGPQTDDLLMPYKVELTPSERKILELSKKWDRRSEKLPLFGDGEILYYLYDNTSVTIISGLFRTTDIFLQPGEDIKHIDCGDTVRWIISVGYEGEGSRVIPHIFIKPRVADLLTTLTILTDRRAYHFLLKSQEREHNAIVGFQYPEDIKRVVDSVTKREVKAQATQEFYKINSIDGRLSVEDLDFNYAISQSGFSHVYWKPLRVYNDGQKTIIEMPKIVKNKEVPVLYTLGHGNEEEIVNYRYKNNRFVVDKLFDKALLVSGSGSNKKSVTIEYKGTFE